MKVVVKSHSDPTITYVVDTDLKTCTCPAFVKGLRRPCKHMTEADPSLAPPPEPSFGEFAGKIVYRTEHSKESVRRTYGRTEPVCPLLTLKSELEVMQWAQEQMLQVLESQELITYEAKARDPSAKWRLVSGIQKAIRRNKPESAKILAWALFNLDRAYLLYRLAVIAVEDVGMGNLPAVTMLFYVLKDPGFRREAGDHGEWLMLSALIDMMATGPKDRNSTDIETLQHVKASPDPTALRDWWDDPKVDDSFLLACRALSDQVDGKNRTQRLVEINADLGVPAAVTFASRESLSRMPYKLGMGMNMIWRLVGASPILGVEDDNELMDDGQIGAYSGAAYDKHCAEGKKAIGYWRKSAGVDGWMTKHGVKDIGKALEMLLFTREGSLCRQRLLYKGSKKIVTLGQNRLDGYVSMEGKGSLFSEEVLTPGYAKLYAARKAIVTRR